MQPQPGAVAGSASVLTGALQQPHAQDLTGNGEDTQPEIDAAASSGVKFVTDPASGCSFMYKLAFVDLDMKPLVKIPTHFELDQLIMSCTLENGDMLSQHLEMSGFAAQQ